MHQTASRRMLLVAASVAVGVLLGALARSIERVGWFLVDGPLLGGMLGFVFGTAVLIFVQVRDAMRRHAWRKWSTPILLVALLALHLPVLGFLAFMLFGPETICLWDPLRDTRLSSPGVLERFQSVRTGMSMAEVVAILGQPTSRAAGVWRYSSDGACQDCDKAWLMLGLRFEDGRVSRIYQQWEPD